jgi:hypothetical protein
MGLKEARMGTEGIISEMATSEPDALSAGQSGIDALKKRREGNLKNRTEEFDVPGYDGMLVAKYRILTFDEARAIGDRNKRGQSSPRFVLNAMVDTLVEACEELMYRRPDGKLVPLDAEKPVRYDNRLSEWLDLGADNARQIVFALFSNDVAIMGHHEKVSEWMQTGRREDGEGEA